MSNFKDLDENRPDPLVNSEERPAEKPAEGVARREDGSLKPGSNLNPSGKNQWTERNRLSAALDTLAEDVPPESVKDRRIIWKRFIELVKRGDPWAMKEYFLFKPFRRRHKGSLSTFAQKALLFFVFLQALNDR